ncbi:PPPDE putative thiol peptidase family protein [Striga hermonthica]|uniref:PPPDE putative thiol peptidase family protein n=1 Tax=Striga hermonthica TaxID=68872 RepID=A0A9N7N2P2_STRHE|nr:PPPDE putative thiol peptidase family protein [Striga hermonthica]
MKKKKEKKRKKQLTNAILISTDPYHFSPFSTFAALPFDLRRECISPARLKAFTTARSLRRFLEAILSTDIKYWSLDISPAEQNNAEKSQAMLYLNVYDLTPINNYLYWVGLGIYHSGIEVHDMEYGFGAHEFSTSGVFEVEPRSCPGFIFRRSIPLGSTDMSRSEFRSFMEHLSNKYHGDTYHLISKNCNHFTDEACQRLTGKSIPGWVNRLARVGAFCNCLLPESIQTTTIRPLPENQMYSENGMESGSSSVTEDSDEEALDHHHLLMTPNSDVAFLKDKPVKLAKDVL